MNHRDFGGKPSE